MTGASHPSRVRVTSSRRQAARPRRVPLSYDVEEQTDLGRVYVGGLMRAQFLLSLAALSSVLVGFALLPVLFTLLPRLGQVTVAHVPLPWFLLGVLPYPLMWWASRQFARQAGRIEDQYAEVIEDHRQ